MHAHAAERLSTFDAVIIGAGPAGSAAARQLALSGHSVALIGRPPARGALAESLPPSCTKLFDRLGIRDLVDEAGFLRATGNTVQWAGEPRRIERFDGNAEGYQVQRDRFDALLVGAARAAGSTVFDDSVVRRVERQDNDWLVSFESPVAIGEPTGVARTGWLLDCSGRSGVMARGGWRRPEPASRTTAVIGVWDRRPAWPLEDDSQTLVESYDGGWAWSVPVSVTQRYVTVMLDPKVSELRGRAQLADAYRGELARTHMLAELVSDATLSDPPWACDASPYSAHQLSGDGVLLVGDAASFVDPLSSFGVKKALASSWLAAVVVHTSLLDSRMTSPALALYAERERAMYEHLQRQSVRLSQDAAGAHETDFWRGRADAAPDQWSQSAQSVDTDVASRLADPRVLDAFEELKRRASVNLQPSKSLRRMERATVRGGRVVLDTHLIAQHVPDGVRFCRNVDLLVIAALAPRFQQVPDLFDAYNRSAPPAALPDFLGALSAMVALDMLTLA